MVKKVAVRKPRAKGMGKRKGSAFEREICKKLSLWISGGKKADLFWRSAMSGGRATVARKKGGMVRQAGDITATTPEGHVLTDVWYIECKAYKQIDLAQFMVTGNGKLAGWWARCKLEARQYGKEPVLIVKQNGWRPLIVARTEAGLPNLVMLVAALDHRSCVVAFLEDMLADPFSPHDLEG